MKTYKLTYFADSSIPSNGADAVHVMSMCKAFAEIGIEVTLIAAKGTTEQEPYSYYGISKDLFTIILVKRPSVRILGGFLYSKNVAKVYNELPKPDFIYARSINSLREIKNNNIPFIFESHWQPQNRVYHYWQKLLLGQKNLKCFVLISEGLKNIYSEIFNKHIDSFYVLHDACDEPSSLLKAKMLDNKRLQVAYVGSFFKGNGFDLVPEMALKMANVDFHIVGGKEKDIKLLKTLYPLENLTFHGHVPFTDLKRLYCSFDVMLAPYQKDLPHIGWVSPMKLFEYMSYSKAIICSDFPVLREVLDKTNGILVEANNLNDWCSSIEILKSTEIRMQLGQSAYNTFRDNYTWKIRAKNILEKFLGNKK